MRKKKIVVLDKMLPSVLAELSKSFEFARFQNTAELKKCGGNELREIRGMICGPSEGPDSEVFDLMPSLEIVANFGVGFDNVDTEAAIKNGVLVTHTPDVLNDEVATTAIALTIMTLRGLPEAERYLRAGRWLEDAFPLSSMTLCGANVGIAGMGRVGRAIAEKLEVFSVDLSYCDIQPVEGAPWPFESSLIDLARNNNVLIVAIPGGPTTQKLIGSEVLEALGPEGALINIGRGDVVDEKALVAALSSGRLGAAGLDVFENEPHVPNGLIALSNVVLLPHVASASRKTREAMGQLLNKNILRWFDGKPALTPVPVTSQFNRRK